MLTVEISNRQTSLAAEVGFWRRMLIDLIESEGICRGDVSVSIVHDDEIHELNRKYLNHDYPTDVLSFVLDDQPGQLQGEIIVSADMAIARCDEFGWQAKDELALYLIHGALHLVGYNDKSAWDIDRMRERERYYLKRFGIVSTSPIAPKSALEETLAPPSTPVKKLPRG